MNLLQELFTQGVLSKEKTDDLKKQVIKTGETEEEVLLEKNIVSEDFLFNLKSKILKIPLKKIKEEEIPAEVLELIPEEASVNYKMASIEKVGNSIQVGMVYPDNMTAQNALRFLASQENFTYQVCLITPSTLANILKQREKMLLENPEKEVKENPEEVPEITDNNSLIKFAEEAATVKTVKNILKMAIDGNASDIHIEPNKNRLRIRFRLNGILHETLSLPLASHKRIVARIKIISNLKTDEDRRPQDGRFSARNAEIYDKEVDFRVSTFPTLYGEKAELRVLDTSTGLRSFEDLGLTGRNLEVVKEAIIKPYGMILFTGPTGSGKTTTQYAILRTLNQDSVNIVTIEDPIEYSIAGVNQSQVKPEIGYSFAQGLRQILRQDPNIIMVGEIRDEETASLAVNAALTGHVVLSTLHTNSSVGVVPRLIDMGVRPLLIPATLRIVISQRLIRTLCPNCKVKIKPVEKQRNYILDRVRNLPAATKSEIKIEEPLLIYQAKGCDNCGSTGYIGRMGLYEVLSMSDELAELIQKNPLESAILKAAQRQGMLTMEQEGIMKVLDGQTTIEEVIRVTGER